MRQQAFKGISSIISINIIFIFVSISIFVFLSLFTYNIKINRIQTISKSRDSSIPLVLIESNYIYDYDLVNALELNPQKTKNEIKNIVMNATHLKETVNQNNPMVPLYTTINAIEVLCFKYNFVGDKNEIKIRQLKKDEMCKDKYTFRTTFPFPKIFDGSSFVFEGFFESYVV